MHSHGLLSALIPWIVSGFYFTLVTQAQQPCPMMRLWFVPLLFAQGAHLQHGCHSVAQRPWSHSQINHSVDFRCLVTFAPKFRFINSHSPSLHPHYSPLSTTWNIITGGLNTQSLHHVLPSVHHCHYPAIYPLFLSVCKRHGVHPKSAQNAAVFVRGYLKWIESLSEDGSGHD